MDEPLTRHRAAGRAGQAAIETTIALLAGVVLMVGSLQLWVWMARTLVERQEAYQMTRRRAGRHAAPGCPKYYEPGQLSVFGEFNVPGRKYPTCQ